MEVYTRNTRDTNLLSQRDRHTLEVESGIDSNDIAVRGYETVKSRAELLDFKKYQRRPGLRIPMYSPDGITQSSQLRPDNPRRDKKGKLVKYETAGGSSCILDVHPRMRDEARSGDGELWITEGIKKGDSLTSRGLCVVSIIGVWNWQRKGEMLPCWNHIRLDGRRVYVVFDSDVMVKAEVQLALERLVAALEARGAEVLVVYLPHSGDDKTGVDDYLVAGGTVTELKMLAREYEPSDVGKIRLSKDAKLRAGIENLARRLWNEEWKGQGGHTEQDLAIKLLEHAQRHGKVVADGIRVRVSHGTLALETKVSSRTLVKAIARLEDRGFAYRDNEGRKADKCGAFVLRASVKQVGTESDSEGNVSQGKQEYDHGTLHLRAPRLRWSSPAVKPRRGFVSGTRRVRQGPRPKDRPAVKRLGKVRGHIIDALDERGPMDINELAATLRIKRTRDLRRRNLPMLEDAGIIAVENGRVSLTENWLDALDEQRRLGGEIEAEETARQRLENKRKAYHARGQVQETPHWSNNPDADGIIEDLERGEKPELSKLAEAMRDYLQANPWHATEPAGWIGSTLWAYDLYDGKPTPQESKAALDELGGQRFLTSLLNQRKAA